MVDFAIGGDDPGAFDVNPKLVTLSILGDQIVEVQFHLTELRFYKATLIGGANERGCSNPSARAGRARGLTYPIYRRGD